MTNTRTLEPRAYYVGALNAFTTSKDEAEKMGKQFPVESLYPAAAYEALQKENERLDFKFKHYWGRIRKVLQKHRERDAAQAKRIAELEAEANKDYVKILRLKDALSAYGDPDIFADDED